MPSLAHFPSKCARAEAVLLQVNLLHPRQIPDGQSSGQRLPGNRCNRRARHAKVADENQQRVKHEVCRRTCQCGNHCECRAAVGADDRVHCLPKDVQRHAQGNPEEIFLRLLECPGIDAPAEPRQQRVREQQVCRHQDKPRDDADRYRSADGAVSILLLPCAKHQADKRAVAVAEHDRNRQRRDRQRKDDRRCCVPDAAQVGRVRNEHLIDHVVQRRHDQRGHARHGVAPHEAPQRLCCQRARVLRYGGFGFCLHKKSTPFR